MGASVGSMLAAPLVAWAILTHSWQFAFVLTGAIGLAWVDALAAVLSISLETQSALSRRNATTSSRARRATSLAKANPRSGLCLRQRNFWGIAIPRFLADPTWGTLTFWLPLYLTTGAGFDLKQIALFAWLPFLAADLGCLFGGTISIALQKRGVGSDQRAAQRVHGRRTADDGRGVCRHRRQPVRRPSRS